MVKGKPRTGKRTRRTRQQMLLEAEAVVMKRAPSSLLGDNNMLMTSTQDGSGTTSSSSSLVSGTSVNGSCNGHKKKSLRIMFQDAKSGKLAEAKKRLNYKYPRTVEAAHCPFADPTGLNKMFFLIAIDLYPDSKIVQPSDSESDVEEVEESGYRSDLSPVDGDLSLQPAMPAASSGDALMTPAAAGVNYDDPDDAFINERSPSPVSPKVKRGRRPNNARRVPYGRAADIDLSWRSNYSRRNVRKPPRNRIKDPQVIQDVINSVIQRYTQRHVVNTPEMSPQSLSEYGGNNSYFEAGPSASVNGKRNGLTDLIKQYGDHDNETRSSTPVEDLIAQNIEVIKQEIATPPDSSSGDDEMDSEEEEDDEGEYFSQNDIDNENSFPNNYKRIKVSSPERHIPCNYMGE